jgi:SAM-dependent methyltransferase
VTNREWFPDETSGAGAEHLDALYVATYDQKSRTDPSEDVYRLLALGLDEDSTVVDIGAGTGAFAAAIARHCRRVVAVDVSPAMVDVLRSKPIANVESVLGGFLSYEHTGGPADAVYSRNTLHHLSDFWKVVALHRVRDMLRPGGVLLLRDLVYAFDPDETVDTIQAWLDGAVDDAATGWTRDELVTHIREEHSTFDWLLRPMLERVGFRIDGAEVSPSKTYGMYVCVKQ